MALVRSSSQAYEASAQSITCTTPAGCVTGDVLVAFVLTDNIGTLSASESWDANPQNGSGGVTAQMVQGIYYTELASSPGANYTFTTTATAGNMFAVLVAIDPDGEAFEGVVSSLVGVNATNTGTTAAVTGVADPSILLCGFGVDDTTTITTAPGTMTLAQNVNGASAELVVYTEVNPGTGSLTRSIVWAAASTDVLNGALLLDFGTPGPTITVQPSAQTIVLTNDTTATFSVTATGTGGLTYDWELETSVGGGSYSNLANGNGATWTGQTASSCTGTLTAKTLTGRRVRCNVTDDNGTTTSTAVALTIYDGPQLTTFPATNGSGVSTATLTCDYVTGVGEAIEVRIPLSDGDVAVTVTTT